MAVKSLLGIFPYEVEIGLGGCNSFQSVDYTQRVAEAFEWLVSEGIVRDKDWKLNKISGGDACSVGFNRSKPALRFKLTWG